MSFIDKYGQIHKDRTPEEFIGIYMLVERTCGGPNAAGGGCGAWYVTGIRKCRQGDRIVKRLTSDEELENYENYGEWPYSLSSAHPEMAIDGGNWVCINCTQE